MPFIRDFTATDVTTASTNPASEVLYPTHEANDVILLSLAVDGTNLPALPTGYTNILTISGAAQRFRLCYKAAASAAEVCPTLSLSASDEWHIVVIAVGGADYADPINVSNSRSTTDNAAPFTWTSGSSTDEDNTLVFQFCNSDSGLALTAVTNGYTNLVNGDCGSAGQGVAYQFQPSSGAITDCVWTGRANDDTTAALVAINDDGTGTRPVYSGSATAGAYISALGGTALIEGDTNPVSLTFGAIGMRDVTKFFAYDGASTYTDDTTDINDLGTADVTIANTIGACWYIGYDYKFNSILLNRSTASNGGTVVWEYWNGSAWSTLTLTSGALTGTGWAKPCWVIPSDWATTSVNSVTLYWIRVRVSGSFLTAPILSQGHIGGWYTAYDAIANAADAGVNPYNDAISLSPAQTNSFSGSERQFGSAKDLDTGVLILHHSAALPRDYAVDPTRNNQVYPVTQVGMDGSNGTQSPYAGFIVVLADADSEYEAYAIHSKGALTSDVFGMNVAAIALNDGAMPYGQIGTLNKSAVTRMLFLPQGISGAMAARVSTLLLVQKVCLAGGHSSRPLDLDDVRFVANQAIGVAQLIQGSGDFCRVYTPLQFGGGGTIYTMIDGAIFQFPTKYDGRLYLDWNADDNVAGVHFYGVDSNDYLQFPNCTWKGSQPYRWAFDGSHSADAVLDFSGSTVDGATVQLRSTVALTGVKFVSCPVFIPTSAELSLCDFVDTPVGPVTPAGASKISDSTFTKTSGTQHAIEVTGTAADITLDGVTFTGYATSNGSTGNEAIYVDIASGSMTIYITGGGSVPSIRTAGATVTVQNTVAITVTVLDAVTKDPVEDARVFIETTPGGTDLMNELTDGDGIATENYNYTADQAIVGRVRKASSSPLYRTGDITGTITSGGFAITVLLIEDE